jgi:hypothetical protein
MDFGRATPEPAHDGFCGIIVKNYPANHFNSGR